jgi:uncharacterized protein YcbX
MTLGAIWRYPVKSMAGERVNSTEIGPAGIAGDRVLQVYDRHDRVVTARRFPRLLQLHGTLGADGEPRVNGQPWHAAEVTTLVENAVAPGARLERFEGVERFDILPLLVCTDGAVSLFGADVRRLRPNLLIEGVVGAAERGWERATLRVGSVLIELADLRGRCVMTTVNPDTGERDPDVLRNIVRQFDGTLCLNAGVIAPGIVREGDEVELIRPAT